MAKKTWADQMRASEAALIKRRDMYDEVGSIDDLIAEVASDSPSADTSAIWEVVVRESARRAVERWHGWLPTTGSVIEDAFLAALLAGFADNVVIPAPTGKPGVVRGCRGGGHAFTPFTDHVLVEAQVSIGKYRADFVLTQVGARCRHRARAEELGLTLEAKASIVVECDGHDFHERTKQQAAHDKQRDRFLQKQGFPVHRFTGSEIWADPFKCAEEALSALDEHWKARWLR